MGRGKYCFIGDKYKTINNKAKMCVEIFANILRVNIEFPSREEELSCKTLVW